MFGGGDQIGFYRNPTFPILPAPSSSLQGRYVATPSYRRPGGVAQMGGPPADPAPVAMDIHFGQRRPNPSFLI